MPRARGRHRGRAHLLHHQARRGRGGQRRRDPVAASRRRVPLVALRMRTLTRAEAEGFYHVHAARPFFGSLCAVHVLGPLHHHGPRARERDRAPAGDHGCDRPGEGRAPGRSARTSPRPSSATPSTARTPRRRRPSRSATSSRGSSCLSRPTGVRGWTAARRGTSQRETPSAPGPRGFSRSLSAVGNASHGRSASAREQVHERTRQGLARRWSRRPSWGRVSEDARGVEHVREVRPVDPEDGARAPDDRALRRRRSARASSPTGCRPTATTRASPTSSRSSRTSTTRSWTRRTSTRAPSSTSRATQCIIPPNSFALARTVERFRIPRDVIVVCLGKVDATRAAGSS